MADDGRLLNHPFPLPPWPSVNKRDSWELGDGTVKYTVIKNFNRHNLNLMLLIYNFTVLAGSIAANRRYVVRRSNDCKFIC